MGHSFSIKILSCQLQGFVAAMHFSLLLSLLFMAFCISLGAKMGFIYCTFYALAPLLLAAVAASPGRG